MSEMQKYENLSTAFAIDTENFSTRTLSLADIDEVIRIYRKRFGQFDTLNELIREENGTFVLRINDRSMLVTWGQKIIGALVAHIIDDTLYVESIVVDHDDLTIIGVAIAELIKSMKENEVSTFSKIRFFCDSREKAIMNMAKRSKAQLVRSGMQYRIKVD